MRHYEEDFNEEYERGYRAGRREALREMEDMDESKATEEASRKIEKSRMEGRKLARGIIGSFSSDLKRLEEVLGKFKNDSDSDWRLWAHVQRAMKEINELRDDLDKYIERN